MATTSNSGRIQGLTVQIGGDTTDLTKALASTNKEIKNTQTALKDVEKLLKLDPTNTELLAQKQKLLNNAVTETKEKLDTLYKAEKQLKEAGIDENSEQFMGLRREIIDTESQLEKAEKSAKNFNVTLSQTAGAFTEIGNKAKEVADKTKALSVAGAAVAGAIGGIAYKAMVASDDLNTLAKQSGLTTEEIQKFQYAADLVDVSSEDIISSLKKMKKNMNSTSSETQEAWQKLGITVQSSNGEFRDSTTVFYEAIEALSKVRNETDRDIIAMQLFGKNADSLAGIIDDGGAALKQYADNAKIWSQESIDAANEVNDIIDTLKADIGQELLITGAKALEAFKPVIEGIADALTKVLDIIGKLSPEVLGIITAIALIVASISPVASLIGEISFAIVGLTTVLGTIDLALAPIIALPVLIGILAVAIYELVKGIIENWDKIKATFNQAVDYIKTNCIDKVVSYFEGVKQRWDDFWENLKERAKSNINEIIDWVNNGITAINNLISAINNSALGQKLNFNIGSIKTIPGLATGGVVSNGGTALVGESGAELLTVNQGQATVTPLTNNNTYNTYNQTNPNPIQVNLNMGGRTLARALVDPLNQINKLNGATL